MGSHSRVFFPVGFNVRGVLAVGDDHSGDSSDGVLAHGRRRRLAGYEPLIYTHIYIYIYMNVCSFIYIYIDVYIHKHTYLYIYIGIYIGRDKKKMPEKER